MNIHRELAILRVLTLRCNEALTRLREARAGEHERGDTLLGWESVVESMVYVALHDLERRKANEIADAYDDKEQHAP